MTNDSIPTTASNPCPCGDYYCADYAPTDGIDRSDCCQYCGPGGNNPVAQILWRRGDRVAYLYRLDQAKTKRTATAAQRQAIAKALRAWRTCRYCRQVKDYYIPCRFGCCLDCHEGSY
ncbi:RRQRL motif-containing zinc-binding protein [Salinispora mooreana]|uniref:RRQRL motif-containing zinc-binding protein n=1 Tax=Salinispora mooreana TaxID=999545 RepID=UPI000376C215|nr:RRQRL motif-containing zinc-binding protein [Salinispora mooreana]